MLLFSTKTVAKTFRKTISEPKLFTKIVNFGAGHEVEAIYEDSMSTGSSIGTVVGFHGAPGTSNDFKYIRDKLDVFGIRFVGLNYPGFNIIKSYAGQGFDNAERQMYTDALLEKLDIPGRRVYMGHSRGAENALQTAVENNAHGLVILNPIGFRPHRTLSPISRIRKIEKIQNALPFIADPLIFRVYKLLGFRVKTSEECVSAMKTMIQVMLDGQIPYIEKLNTLNTKVLFMHAGKDGIIQSDIVFEVLEKYKGLVDFNFKDEPDNEEITRCFRESGKGASVFIENDTHFQNKFRAELIATSIQSMLLSENDRL